jgi:lipopolysaccharide biosynthesis protein
MTEQSLLPRPVKSIAFYLPQFHPIPENDEWWGRGFTEWTNVVKARPRFRGHYQPHLPADLGFYDLRLAESRRAQADLAREYGVHGFCYYHYWFHGKPLLERPLEACLELGEPAFPFCVCWANENWTRKWDGLDNETLIAQQFSIEDHLNHIRSLAPIFADSRYIRIDGKPVFLVYRVGVLPEPLAVTDLWREEALRHGIGELYLCRVERTPEHGDPRPLGFDAAVEFHPNGGTVLELLSSWRRRVMRLQGRLGLDYDRSLIVDYRRYVDRHLTEPPTDYPRFPCVMTGFDNSPRTREAIIVRDATPDVYHEWLRHAMERANATRQKFVFINAWNEWAEGAHLEPCQKWGRAYLEATRAVFAPERGRALETEPISVR